MIFESIYAASPKWWLVDADDVKIRDLAQLSPVYFKKSDAGELSFLLLSDVTH